jgi:predicted aconitase with swiveling domain
MPELTSMVWVDSPSYVIQPDNFFVCVTVNGAVLTLPSAKGSYGKSLIIKNTGTAKNTTIHAETDQTIDGAESYVMNKLWACIPLCSDGANWLIMG